MSETNIIICGVGGQGILLASKVLSLAALYSGYDVKQSEVHGMAQRGGSVNSHVRFGDKIYSPVIQEKSADFILGFERLETVRYLYFLKKGGFVICNDMKIKPVNIEKYPVEDIENSLKESNALVIDSLKFCDQLGSKKIINIFLLGVLSNHLPISNEIFEKVIKETVKEKFTEVNLKAYYLGRKEGLV